MKRITVEVAEKLLPILTKPKRIKIAVGGRGASKSIGFADAWIKFCDDGERLVCAREFQNSIDDSVHSLLKARMKTLGADNLSAAATNITSTNGGEIFYRGLSRNPDAIKSLFGVNRVWVEEGATLSQHTLDVLLPTIREANSEIWISMNRGSSKDPVYKTLIKPYEAIIAKQGYYEDDDLLIVEINYQDNPFFPEVLEKQRQRDFAILPRPKYDHIWGGKCSDTVEDCIIYPEWFDACVDAHVRLGFEPIGAEIVSHDPSDMGPDPKALAHRHGSIIVDCLQKEDGDVNDGCDWALDYAIDVKADMFVWDGDGIGAALRKQVNDALDGKKIEPYMFKGSEMATNPDSVYEPMDGEVSKAKTNRETFFNSRAQGYWMLRDRMFRTWQAIEKGMYHNPDELISFSSKIKEIEILRSEICRIPKKDNGSGRIQILSKPEMKKLGIDSPNMGDAVMMTLPVSAVKRRRSRKDVNYTIPQAYSAF